MSSGWGCQHLIQNDYCQLLDKPCVAGQAGCVLYGKFTFSNPENPSNKAVEKRKNIRSTK